MRPSRAEARSGLKRRPLGLVARQAVGQSDPRKLRQRLRVVLWRDALWMVHAGHGDVEVLGAGGELERERRAATIAEGPLGASRGRDARRRAGNEHEVARPDARPGHEWRSGEPPADRAVTVRDVVQGARRAPPHGTTEASTLA